MPAAPAPAVTRADATVVVLGLATLAVGIPVDASGAWWAQPVVSAWTWTVLGIIGALVGQRERRELAACVVLATLGELFLKDVWGLYDYRLGNLPLFIPPGHALVFASARRLARVGPRGLPLAVAVTFAAVVVRGAWLGTDTFGVVWFGVFLAYVRWAVDPRLCASLFLFALAIESYGTALGGWRYVTSDPWFQLTTTNPPVWIGAIYCTLEALVRLSRAPDWGFAVGIAANKDALHPDQLATGATRPARGRTGRHAGCAMT